MIETNINNNIFNQKPVSKKHHKRWGLNDYLFFIPLYIFFGLFCLTCIFPFWYLFVNTISDNSKVTLGVVIIIPKGIHFNNYINIFKLRGIWRAMLVSVLRTVFGTGLVVFTSTFVGYLTSKREMWGRKFWYRFIIITMYFNAGIIPWYLLMRNLHLTNNFLGYIIPGMVSPYFIILSKTYIESINSSIEEAAIIDGAGSFRIFCLIIFPLSIPIIATIAIFSSVGHWNAFIDNLYLVTDENLFTLQFLLQRYLNQADYLARIIRSGGGSFSNINPEHMVNERVVQMTITMVVVIPIFMIYPFFQRFFIKGIMMGAVKG